LSHGWLVCFCTPCRFSFCPAGSERSASSFPLRNGFCFAPRVRGKLLPFHCVEAFLPHGRGAVARAGRRAQPSDPPSHATEQAQTGVRTLAVPLARMRRSVGASVSTRRSGRSVPARSGAMAPSARGADLPAAPPLAGGVDKLSRPSGLGRRRIASRGTGGLKAPLPHCRAQWLGGVINPPGGCQRPCLRRLRVTERASRGGVSLAWLHTNSEGPHRGTSLLGRSRRSLGAPRAGASKRRVATHPPGNKKPHAVKTKGLAAHPPGNKKPHAVKTKGLAAHPLGNKKPHAVKTKGLAVHLWGKE
jgi:hypothetical protein